MASSNMTRPVRQKASDSEEEDRISNLPESILGLILSCLPTKHAVATCVLSKRWLYLWTCITGLHFDDSLFPLHEAEKRINNFENFVSSVLLGLNNSSIQSFSLHVARKIDPSIANAWISTILKRGVKNLTISSPEKCDFINPIIPYPKNVIFLSRNNLFSCNSLINLILNISCTVRLLASVHLPNLQNLELCGVKLMGESSGANKDMTLSFPVLKKFKAQILWLNMHSVTLQVPLLEVVDINCCSYDCIIKLCASRVREFSYVSYQSQYFILSDPSSALNASAYIRICNPIVSGDNELRRRACMLIRQFNQVKSLKLESIVGFGNTIESFVDLPTFEMLHHLKLRDVTRVKVLMVLLQKTPNLISLEIEVPYKLRLEDFAIVPDCFSTLKVVKFGNFGGYHNELRLVKYIMENAVALERLSFSPHREAKILRSFKKKMEDTVKLLYVMKGFNLTILDVSELLGD